VRRKRVIDAAKELSFMMSSACDAGDFVPAPPSSHPSAAGGATLNDVNNSLRLLVDAVRRLVEVGSFAVRTTSAYEMRVQRTHDRLDSITWPDTEEGRSSFLMRFAC
jgi:hypothetical protein